MKNFISYSLFAFYFIAFFDQAQSQDSVFITDRYKWDLGIGITANMDGSNPISLVLKKHVSPRTTWRLGMGFNHNKTYDKDFRIFEDNDLVKVFIEYEVDRKEKNTGFAVSAGIQRNYIIKNLNLYFGIDIIGDYKFYKILSPDGIKFLDNRIPDDSHFILFKENTLTGYGLSIKPLIGLSHPLSKRLSVSLETTILYRAAHNRNQEFYYSVTSNNGNVGHGFTYEAYNDFWNYRLSYSLIPLFLINYHFD